MGQRRRLAPGGVRGAVGTGRDFTGWTLLDPAGPGWDGRESVEYTLLLVVSELVTNAALHGHGCEELVLTAGERACGSRCSTELPSPGPYAGRPPAATASTSCVGSPTGGAATPLAGETLDRQRATDRRAPVLQPPEWLELPGSFPALPLLDEATCPLDPRTKERAERALTERPGTLVALGHRLSTAVKRAPAPNRADRHGSVMPTARRGSRRSSSREFLPISTYSTPRASRPQRTVLRPLAGHGNWSNSPTGRGCTERVQAKAQGTRGS